MSPVDPQSFALTSHAWPVACTLDGDFGNFAGLAIADSTDLISGCALHEPAGETRDWASQTNLGTNQVRFRWVGAAQNPMIALDFRRDADGYELTGERECIACGARQYEMTVDFTEPVEASSIATGLESQPAARPTPLPVPPPNIELMCAHVVIRFAPYRTYPRSMVWYVYAWPDYGNFAWAELDVSGLPDSPVRTTPVGDGVLEFEFGLEADGYKDVRSLLVGLPSGETFDLTHDMKAYGLGGGRITTRGHPDTDGDGYEDLGFTCPG